MSIIQGRSSSLNTIIRTTTPEYLGDQATARDVKRYLAIVKRMWPTEDPTIELDWEQVNVIDQLAFAEFCDSK